MATEPATAPQATTSTWWYDGPEGDLSITYSNLTALSSAAVTADFRRNELLSQIIVAPNLLQPSASFAYQRGSWTSEVSIG